MEGGQNSLKNPIESNYTALYSAISADVRCCARKKGSSSSAAWCTSSLGPGFLLPPTRADRVGVAVGVTGILCASYFVLCPSAGRQKSRQNNERIKNSFCENNFLGFLSAVASCFDQSQAQTKGTPPTCINFALKIGSNSLSRSGGGI